MRSLLVILSASFVLGAAPSLHAAMLRSAALQTGDGNVFVCAVTNTSNKPIEATIEIVSSFGTVQSSFGPAPINPETVLLLDFAPGTNVIFTTAWCRADVKGGKKKVRGVFTVRENGAPSNTIATVPLD